MLAVAKRTILKSIEELSSRAQFALIFGGPENRGFVRFPQNGKPVEATPDNKRNAAIFLASAPVDGSPPVAIDLIAALRSAEQLSSNRRSIIYVGRGIITDDTPENVLAEVKAENRLRVTISVIGIEPPLEGEEFLKELAHQNGGTYKRVD
jgi:Mg-chelatase subunit ChlD